MNFYRFFPIVILLIACTSTSTSRINTDSAENTDEKIEPTENVQNTPIESSKHFIADKVTKKATTYLGLLVHCKPEMLADSSKQVLKALLSEITRTKSVITGPLTFIYDTKVEAETTNGVFVALPVDVKGKPSAAFVMRNVPASVYYRYQSEGAFGQSAKQHQAFAQLLEKKKILSGYPVLEILTETRNAEMTVVARSVLLYPAK